MLELNRLKTLSGFGGAHHNISYLYRPTQPEQLHQLFETALQLGISVGLRGSGRSYGDAALNAGQIVLDLQRMNRILAWDPVKGIIKTEPGVTIQRLWQYTLEDGWWPAVVPGTMAPTLGGCLAMNVHGKNNYQQGTFGEHILEFTALLPSRHEVTCSPTKNSELFYSIIGGLGVLAVITSITLQLKRIYSGDLWVEAWTAPTLEGMMEELESRKDSDAYLVGWLDGLARGKALGRGQMHSANDLAQDEDTNHHRTLHFDHQNLPDTMMGLVPTSILWRLMTPWMNNPGTQVVNAAKYYASRFLGNHKIYRQPHAGFHFLLDYIPNWVQSYGKGGLLQYQCFISTDNAADAFREIMQLTHRRRLPSYLVVLKRHRPDKFLLSHALDGYSLALDFKVTAGNRERLQLLADDLNKIVLDAGGRFYFAKDSTLTSYQTSQFLGDTTIEQFRALKDRCDPDGLLQTDLYRRLFPDS